MCAAPGGKSTHIDSILSNESTLVANEVIGTRNAILQENITKWGSHKVIVTQNDAKDIGKCETMFDAIVIDAPCSGSGLFRRDNNAIVEWSEQNVQLCSERQQRIIAELLPALKPNGLLLYSTCSYSPKENEDVVDWLTSTFSLKSLSIPIEATWGISSIETAGHNICYRFWPHLVKGEGFFMAALQNSDALSKEWNKQKAKNNLGISKQQQQCIESLQFEYAFAPHYFEHANNIFVTNERTLLTIQQLKQYLHIKKAGVKLGQVTKYDIIPEHELALAAAIQLPYNIIELEKVAALKYLKKVELELIGAKNGWNLIQQNGVNLGFIKYLGNRYNNYYPKNWRIRMDIE
jgi:NOL1/NOP2/fmu family ribosome biogenesis protein